LDIVVRNRAVAFRVLLREFVVGGVWVGGYNVPGVEEAGEETETCVTFVSLWLEVGGGIGWQNIQQSARFMRLSAEHKPLLTQTAMGGKRTARRPRKMSEPHMAGGVVGGVLCVLKVVE